MSSLIASMDNYEKKLNEKGHIELGWSEDLTSKIVQFYFQLVRSENTEKLEIKLEEMLIKIKNNEFSNMKHFIKLYKLIGHTRDIISGKGEQKLAFMQIWVWWKYYPELAEYAFTQMVVLNDDRESHPYGSWKDIKYFCKYVKERSGRNDHPLINKAIDIAIINLNTDINIFYESSSLNKNDRLSLIARWLPREKSAFGWVFKKMALKMNPHFLETAKTEKQHKKAKIKAYITLKKQLITLNKKLDTAQIKMCHDKWSDLDFNNVTTQTLRRNRRALMNINKDNTVRSQKEDRKNCAENYHFHREASKVDPIRHKIHGKRANVYEYVKDAIELQRTQEYSHSNMEETANNIVSQVDAINLQWNSNKKNNKGLEKIPIISMIDASGSMEMDKCTPLFNAIGLGIRTSELTHPAFKHRAMTFSSNPHWINLEDISDNFVKKVWKLKTSDWGMNTNFYKALLMILDVIVEKNISPREVEGMVLAVFSDMKIDTKWFNIEGNNKGSNEVNNEGNNEQNMNTMFDNIKDMYKEAGLRSKFNKAYNIPHILFWNLRLTDGFPAKTSQNNVTFISGYSSVLLNNFCSNGMETFKQYTPELMLDNILDNKRLRSLEIKIMDQYA